MQESPTAEIQTIPHGPEARVTGALPVDPMPVGKLGMWLFLASEAMFFVGLLSAFIVLESAGSQHQLFVKSSQMLSKWLGATGVVLLVFSSFAIGWNGKWLRWIAMGASLMFLLSQEMQWWKLQNQHTIVYKQGGSMFVCNGPGDDRKMPLPERFDIHAVTAGDFKDAQRGDSWLHSSGEIRLDANYGPSRNNFFACYFLMTAAHVLHLLAGLIAMLWFTLFAKRKIPQPLQIYWHFVNAVGVLTFVTLYFV